MIFSYPSQSLQDWLSQQWVKLNGRTIDPSAVPWLAAPYGHVDVIGDHFASRLAAASYLGISGPSKPRAGVNVANIFPPHLDGHRLPLRNP
jgi:hypothetical protein